jgi:carbon starvation protein
MSTTEQEVQVPTGTARVIRTDPDRPPVAVIEPKGSTPLNKAVFVGVGILCALGWTMIAIVRGERVSAVWFVLAAVGSYLLAIRFYSRLIEVKLLKPDDTRMTPAEKFNNGKDFMPTDRRVLFGHHFAAIAGAGPLVGPVLAAQMGYLPGTIWIIVGVVLAGAVQDYMVLHLSVRRDGRSLGQMARDELGPVGGWAALIGVMTIMIIIIAVLGVVVIGALAESPWGVFSIAMTIPIALFMGVYLRILRPGKVTEVSLIGVMLLVLAIVAGRFVSESATLAPIFTLSGAELALWLAAYGFAASVLPVWLLLAPRDYLSTFMKVGTIVMLAIAILVAAPTITQPAVSQFAISGEGPAFAGELFPFLFITIACGALSGFHALISSGTTPKLIEKESQARIIGYGGMLTESFVAIMALVAACVIDQHLYFVMNSAAGLTSPGFNPAAPDYQLQAQQAADYANSMGLLNPAGNPLPPIDPATLTQAAADVGESTIVSRTGGAPTLAFGMAEVMSQIPLIGGLKAFWYHFAIMFEALFILTTIDAGTRVARFMLTDTLGNLPGLTKLKDPSWRVGAWICSAVVVLAWGSLLYMGVTDPLGGIRMLFPLFGIANQLLAAIALCVVFTIVMKKGLYKWAWIPGIPLVWDLVITLWASWEKIFSSDPKMGYWIQNSQAREAAAAGLPYQTASTAEEVEAVVRNTFVQGTLSIVYAVLVAIVFIVTVLVAIKAVRQGGLPVIEAEPVPSRIFAPKSFVATPAERQVLAAWQAAGLDPIPEEAKRHS